MVPIKDFEKYESEFYEKQPKLPDLILAFNSKRRVLKLQGYPCLFKEIAEIIECGELSDKFRAVEYIKAIERYASVQQRWGL